MPRRLIYGQAALLGVSAITFFMLGMMVGNLTAPERASDSRMANELGVVADCRISGSVVFTDRSKEQPDVGSVVLLIPKRTAPSQLLAPGLVMPETFVALDNPTIDSIHQAGGAVVRANAEGRFDVLVDRSREYRLLVLSKRHEPKGRQLSESQQLVLAKWFAPSEKLIRDNDFQWRDVTADGEQVDLAPVEFN